jgi:hypothetical protein
MTKKAAKVLARIRQMGPTRVSALNLSMGPYAHRSLPRLESEGFIQLTRCGQCVACKTDWKWCHNLEVKAL